MINGLTKVKARSWLAFMALAGFILSLGTLAFFPVPDGNRELFSAAMGGLNILLGALAGYYWPRGNPPAPPEA